MDICTGNIVMTSAYYVKENFPTADQRLPFCEWCLHNGCTNGDDVTTEVTRGCCCCPNSHPKLEACVCLNHSKTTIFSIFRGMCSLCKAPTSHEKLKVCDQCSAILKVCRVCGLKYAKPYREYQKEIVTETFL